MSKPYDPKQVDKLAAELDAIIRYAATHAMTPPPPDWAPPTTPGGRQ